jgi:hypothetical protein
MIINLMIKRINAIQLIETMGIMSSVFVRGLVFYFCYLCLFAYGGFQHELTL